MNRITSRDLSILNLPTELFTEIFLYLCPSEICNYSMVCKDFYKAANTPYLWKEISKRDRVHHYIIGHFKELLDKEFISWKWSYLCSGLSQSLNDNISQRIYYPYTSDIEILEKNGDSYIYIGENFRDITVEKNGKTRVLKGDENIKICYLLSDKNDLFSFREDGKIVMWDLKKGEIIKIIDSIISMKDFKSFKKKNSALNNYTNNVNKNIKMPKNYKNFCVKDGYIVITYAVFNGEHIEGRIIEVIPYFNLKERYCINIDGFDYLVIYKNMIKEKKLYLLTHKKIIIFDLVKLEEREIKFRIGSEFYDMDISDGIICITAEEGVFILDEKKGEVLKNYRKADFLKGPIKMIRNILLFYNGYGIFNLNTGKFINKVKTDSFKYYDLEEKKFKTSKVFIKRFKFISFIKINPQFLKECIKKIKENLKPLKIKSIEKEKM